MFLSYGADRSDRHSLTISFLGLGDQLRSLGRHFRHWNA